VARVSRIDKRHKRIVMPDTPIQSVKREPVQVTYAPAPRSFRRRLGAAFRYWARSTFSRESFVSSFKSLLWVAPLTILIWIYAEREQVVTFNNVPVNLETRSNEPGRVVRLVSPAGGTVHVEMKGPQAELDQVKEWLESTPIPIEAGHNLTEGDHQVFVAAELNRLPQVVSKGVTVTSSLPEDIKISVDPIISRELDVKVPAEETKTLDGAQVFSPSKVKISGPKSILSRLGNEGQPLVAYVDLGPFKQQLDEPGKHTLATVAVTPSVKLDDPSITLSPATVSATIVVADTAETPLVLPYVRVLAAYPPVSDPKIDQFKPVYESTLSNVTVTGPESQIALLKEQKIIPAAFFEVEYKDADTGKPPPPAPVVYQLPPGVHVSDQDKQRTITYTFKPRNPGEPQ
jgi:hypothetical protein